MTPRISAGTLWAADLSPRRGTEPGKVRPVLVVQTDMLSGVAHPSTVVAPCTTRRAGESLLRVELPVRMASNRAACEVMIDQLRAIDNRRLRKALGRVPRPVLLEVREKLRRLLDL